MIRTNIISLLCLVVISLSALAGCAETTNGISAIKPATDADKSATEPAPPGHDIMATVDGEPIYMAALHDLLVRSSGMATAQQLIANKVVDQQAARAGIEITDADIETAMQKTLDRMLPEATSRDQQERVLEGMLAQNGMPRELWGLNMRRVAILAKLAEGMVSVTDEEIEAAFVNIYGRRVQVKHIQTATPTEAQDVLDELDKGADFSELARRLSKHQSARNGGYLPPIAANTPGIPPAIASAAMALTEPGEISDPIQIGTTFHVLELQEVTQAQDIDIESVRDELAAKVHQDQIEQISKQMLQDLIESAQIAGKIRLINPILKAKKK